MKKTKYVSKKPDASGKVEYTEEENEIWRDLYTRQMQILPSCACEEYLEGIKALDLKPDQIPQIPDINKCLRSYTGWEVTPVPSLIDFQTFFELMANRKFPAATFIRTREELDYLQEPDIFHEIFGHCPLITLPAYADFMHEYAKLGLKASQADRVMLARLYWFTIEFGLIQTEAGLKIYGGGILSSHGESLYCLDNSKVLLKPLQAIEALRTPYRIDILQPLYFVLEDFSELFNFINLDLIKIIEEARRLGMHEPLFEPKPKVGTKEDERFL